MNIILQLTILLCFSVPTENVATIPHNAIVTEGVSRSRNALINGDIRQYDWDSGYTCHQLGSGCIVIQFPQPYIIGCMRYYSKQNYLFQVIYCFCRAG